jgi:tRNA (guanine9-N1)-methyltransferase
MDNLEEPTETVSSTTALSKNAQKRLLKQQKFAETRAEWKAKTREKKRARRALKRLESLDDPKIGAQKTTIDQEPKLGQILVDLSFEGLMNQKEIVSLSSQICRCYALNRRTTKPYRLVVMGLGGELERRMKTAFPEYTKWDIEFSSKPLEEYKDKQTIVYLSPDADKVLSEIDPECTYVIGGLIDRNRHKNAAAIRANELGVETVKLPLGDHIKLKSSQVLTIVHVYELMCKQRECGSWAEAISAVIPERKRVQE